MCEAITVEFSKPEAQQIIDALAVLGWYRRRLEHELLDPQLAWIEQAAKARYQPPWPATCTPYTNAAKARFIDQEIGFV